MKKIITESETLSVYVAENIWFYIEAEVIHFNVEITVDNNDYRIGGLSFDEWIRKMIHNKKIQLAEDTVSNAMDTMIVDNLDIDYIFMTLYRILKQITPYTNIKSFSYETI